MTDPTHKREPKYLLQRAEQFILPRLASRLPAWVTPDHLTSLGLLSCFLIGLCYALSGQYKWLLLLTVPLWLLNWLGDSLDGTLARIRRIQRPFYGYYLDHMVDMLSAAAVCIGIGLSPYVSMGPAITLLLLYYLLSINVFLETLVLKKFQYGYGFIGPTEVRILLSGLAIFIYFRSEPTIHLLDFKIGIGDIAAASAALFMIISLVYRIISNLDYLGKIDPPNVVKH